MHPGAITANDVTAVVLSLGERTTERAIASVRRQTLAPREVLVIGGVAPFHRALNLAASRVSTPFFLQVDSDMVLDDDCLKILRSNMTDGAGAVVGPLRDLLMGSIAGVKLFRRACFEHELVPNSVSPDTDFLDQISRHGWQTLHLLKTPASPGLSHTFGEHRPGWTGEYAFATYYLLGTRYRYLLDSEGLAWRLGQLRRSRHPVATVALIAMGHGLFFPRDDDVPKSAAPTESLWLLEEFLRTDGDHPSAEERARSCLALPVQEALERAYELGIALRRAWAFPALRRCVGILGAARSSTSWVAEVGLYHGLLSRSEAISEADRGIVSDLLAR